MIPYESIDVVPKRVNINLLVQIGGGELFG